MIGREQCERAHLRAVQVHGRGVHERVCRLAVDLDGDQARQGLVGEQVGKAGLVSGPSVARLPRSGLPRASTVPSAEAAAMIRYL